MTPPRVLFRCDAGAAIGGGHVMRCLALAEAAAARGLETAFCVNAGAEQVAPALLRHDGAVVRAASDGSLSLPESWGQADIIVADQYSADAAALAAMRACGRRLAVIDDLGDRPLDADMVINPNPADDASRHDGLIPAHARVLAGADYALLRSEFAALRDEALLRRSVNGPVRRVLVSLGLSDVGGVTGRAVEAVMQALPHAGVDVLVGAQAPSRTLLERLASEHDRVTLAVDAADMARRCTDADLAVGAGGQSSLERCTLGLPSVTVVVAENQRRAADALARSGATAALDDGPDLAARLTPILRALGGDPAARERMSRAAAKICDGLGAMRAAEAIAVTCMQESGP